MTISVLLRLEFCRELEMNEVSMEAEQGLIGRQYRQ